MKSGPALCAAGSCLNDADAGKAISLGVEAEPARHLQRRLNGDNTSVGADGFRGEQTKEAAIGANINEDIIGVKLINYGGKAGTISVQTALEKALLREIVADPGMDRERHARAA
jgi:hypothetical protein